MKKAKIFITLAAFAIASSTTLNSCKKKTDEDNDTSEAQDHSYAERTSNDINNIGAQVNENGNNASFRNGSDNDVFGIGCATLYRDTVRHIDSLVFDGTACHDGRVRSGALAFHYSSSAAPHYRDPGFSCSVKSYNYVVDGNQVNIINKSITNTTPAGFDPSNTNLSWTIVENISIAKAGNAGTHSFQATRYKTLLNTSDNTVYQGPNYPINWSKAYVGITGSASGTTCNGRNYTANIINQLVRHMDCSPDSYHPGHHPFIQGVLEFTPSGKPMRTIDYGSGTCDLIATVTINGRAHTITLR